MGYTKLFSEIVASSIWEEDDKTRIVWITMLALKDRMHFVRGTPSYLARVARVTDDECRCALSKLSGPDPHSRSLEHDGRRIAEVAGGWTVLNGEKYQKALSYEERREYNRQKQAEYRLRKKGLVYEARCAGAREAIKDGLDEAMEPLPKQ
jgi:hypothetical protein